MEKPGGERSPEWRTVRRRHLGREPSCQMCGGRELLEVHHIAPFHLHPDRELDESNLITLCEKRGHDCHFVAGHFHDWRAFNPDVRAFAAAYLAAQQKAFALVG